MNSVNSCLAYVINSAISNRKETFRTFVTKAELRLKREDIFCLMHCQKNIKERKSLKYKLCRHKNATGNGYFCVHI